MDELKLKIVGGGDFENTRIVDIETGRRLPKVMSIRQINSVLGEQHYEVTIEVDSIEFPEGNSWYSWMR